MVSEGRGDKWDQWSCSGQGVGAEVELLLLRDIILRWCRSHLTREFYYFLGKASTD